MAKASIEVATVRALTRAQFPPRRPTSRRETSTVRHDRRRTRGWGWRDNIVGFGVGVKRTAGERVKNSPCVTVFVRRKLPKGRLGVDEIVPEWLELDATGGQVMTDIVVLGSRPVAHGARVRPLQPGAEIGHSRGGRGTLGLLVKRSGSDETLALSCSHVLARSGRQPDEILDIEQPVPDGSDDHSDLVGTLLDGFSRIKAGSTARNTEDVALARLSVAARPQLIGTAITPLTASVLESHQFAAGMRTLLNGALTKEAHGLVLAHESTFVILDMPFVNGEVPFTGLVAYQTRCARGDSGAAVMKDGASEVLGIHTAGISEERFGLFQPIGPILKRLNVTLVTA